MILGIALSGRPARYVAAVQTWLAPAAGSRIWRSSCAGAGRKSHGRKRPRHFKSGNTRAELFYRDYSIPTFRIGASWPAWELSLSLYTMAQSRIGLRRAR